MADTADIKVVRRAWDGCWVVPRRFGTTAFRTIEDGRAAIERRFPATKKRPYLVDCTLCDYIHPSAFLRG